MPPVAANRPLRVLWLIRGLGPGGAEHLLASAAAKHDKHSVILEAAYLIPWKDALVGDLQEKGVTVHCLDVRTPADLRWLVRLIPLVRRGQYDVVHMHSPVVAGLARPLLRLLPTPRRRPALVYTEHNRWPGYRPATRWINRVTYSLDDAHLAVSDETRETISQRHRPKVEVAVQGIVLDRIAGLRQQRPATRTELGLAPDVVAVVTVANLRAQKAYPDLLQAARIVLAENPKVVWLAIGQGPLEAEMKALARTLELGDRFRFLGHRPDAMRLVAGCDIFALSSRHEGYPVAIMEALALGLPVVATAVGAVPQAVTDGVNGFVVPSARPDLLARAILQVAAAPALRTRLGAAALTRGQAYDIAGSVRVTEALYRRLAAPRVGSAGRS